LQKTDKQSGLVRRDAAGLFACFELCAAWKYGILVQPIEDFCNEEKAVDSIDNLVAFQMWSNR